MNDYIPTDPASLGYLIMDMPDGPAPRPDLFDHLVEQEGYERASKAWGRACAYMDWLMDPDRNEEED